MTWDSLKMELSTSILDPAAGVGDQLLRSIRYDGSAMASTQDFNGKWALVTGASAGIGVALARELAGHGAKLILTARRKERLDTLAAELRAKGTEVRIVAADLNDPAAPQQIYDATEGAGLTVDILINNAGLGQFGEFYKSPSSRN